MTKVAKNQQNTNLGITKREKAGVFEVHPKSWTNNWGYIMKYKKHGIKDLVKYIQLLETGKSVRSI
ncbi:MAG: hypothetical protein KIH02_06840, partial [Parabacteroides sp.]|nr:hypothetical protein [Parabacteroides sp.]